MKKTLAALLGSILILSACSDSSEEPVSEETGTEEASEDASEKAAEDNTEEAAGEDQAGNSDRASSELIDSAVANSEGISSYVAQQSLNITGADDKSTIRTIMTFGGQNEFKLSVNDNGNIVTHYVVEGGHFMYADNEIVQTEETVDIEGNDYQTIVASLENYPEGEVSELEEGHAITINVEDASALGGLADEETLKQLEAADSINGTIQLYFDAKDRFTGSELTADVDSEGEKLAVHSTVDYTNIDDVEMIEKPRDMSEEE